MSTFSKTTLKSKSKGFLEDSGSMTSSHTTTIYIGHYFNVKESGSATQSRTPTRYNLF